MAERLDDFRDISSWMPIASGEARLDLSRTSDASGDSLTLDFDFHGAGGFVVARRAFNVSLPPVYTLSFRVRGAAPPNRLEMKLVDTSGKNVWWYRREQFEPTSEWMAVAVRSRDLEFAWGPAGGGVLRELGAIEIAVVAPPGGCGTISIADLELENRSIYPAPRATASRSNAGHAAAAVLDSDFTSSWRSGPTESAEWLEIDFGAGREHGGFVVDWEPGREASEFDVTTSLDGTHWTLIRSVRGAAGARSYLYAEGGGDVRYLRLDLHRAIGAEGFGICSVEVAPFEFSRSIETLFAGIAAREPRGRFPRWLYGEQAYWTPIAAAEGSPAALLNQDGLLETAPASFALEPSISVAGKLYTWADAEAGGASTARLEDKWLPLPTVAWRECDGVQLSTSAFTADSEGRVAITARYVVLNTTSQPLTATLYIAIRPFQVDPPWQAFRGMGGATRIESIAFEEGVVWVNGERAILAATPPDRFGAASFDDGAITSHMACGRLPSATRVVDAFGYASAALAYDLELDANERFETLVAVPFDRFGPEARASVEGLRPRPGDRGTEARAQRAWRERFSRVELELGHAGRRVADTVRTASCHILTNRNGPALQPGPRRYTRSWIRDGATMSAALLRMGRAEEVCDFVRWYLPHQADDGYVPCCVDELGVDWLVEHDSHGQLVFNVMEHYRLARDLSVLEESWTAVEKAARYIEAMCALRSTPVYASGDKKPCYGLMPESASHEGYLAQPVHSYWDDFWALRGLDDASEMAALLGEGSLSEELAASASKLRSALYASIRAVIEKRKLAYIPGSVEWADFDPSATSIALQIGDASERLPRLELHATFDQYMKGFRRRRDGEIDWANYTAYEIRIVGALVRLGRRAEANELLDFLLDDTRPQGWNQWPEISWKDPRSGAHLGDLPHSWIGAEYVLAMLSMLAYERRSDDALILAAGVPERWLGDSGRPETWRPIRVGSLPTYYGALGYTLTRESEDTLRLNITSPMAPPGGLVLRPPLSRSLTAVTVDGRNVMTFDDAELRLQSAPADVIFHY